jgi:hypothetical protein
MGDSILSGFVDTVDCGEMFIRFFEDYQQAGLLPDLTGGGAS